MRAKKDLLKIRGFKRSNYEMTIRFNVINGSPLIAIDTIKAGDSVGIQSTMVACLFDSNFNSG